MQDFATRASATFGFQSHDDLRATLKVRAESGMLDNPLEILGSFGWTNLECENLKVLIFRLKRLNNQV